MDALARALLVVALVGPQLSCGPDTIEIPDELQGEPYCALIIGTFGHHEDGSKLLIADYDQDWVTGGCVCGSAEEVYAGTRDEDLNAAALEECQRQAAKQSFAWDECLEDYESGVWLNLIVLAEGDDAHVAPGEFECY